MSMLQPVAFWLGVLGVVALLVELARRSVRRKSAAPPLVFMCAVIMLVLAAVPTYVWLCYKANKACVSEGGIALQAYKSVPEWCVMPDGHLVPIGRRPK